MSINETIITLNEECENLTEAFCEFRNCMAAEIDADGNISYSLDGDTNWVWATEDQLVAFTEWVNNQ